MKNYLLFTIACLILVSCGKEENVTIHQEDQFLIHEKKDIECPRQNVPIGQLANELDKIANCGNTVSKVCDSDQEEFIESFHELSFPIAFFCSGTSSCTGCAPSLPSLFTPSDQDAFISQAVQFLQNSINNGSIDIPCGDPEIYYNFGGGLTTCGQCGDPDINGCSSGTIITSNAVVTFGATIRCCIGKVKGN